MNARKSLDVICQKADIESKDGVVCLVVTCTCSFGKYSHVSV